MMWIVVAVVAAVFAVVDVKLRHAAARRGADPSDEFGRIVAVVLADRALRRQERS